MGWMESGEGGGGEEESEMVVGGVGGGERGRYKISDTAFSASQPSYLDLINTMKHS